MLKPRKIPMRMCVGCHEMKPKKELQRLVRSPEGVVNIDPTGRMPGRGAYVCFDVNCLKTAHKSRALERKFENPVSNEVYEELEKKFMELKAHSDEQA